MICKREGCPDKIKGHRFLAEVVYRNGQKANEMWCHTCAQKLEPNKYVLRYKIVDKKLRMDRYPKENPQDELKGLGDYQKIVAPIVQAPLVPPPKPPRVVAPVSPPPATAHSKGAGVNTVRKEPIITDITTDPIEPAWSGEKQEVVVIAPIEDKPKKVAKKRAKSTKKEKALNYFDEIAREAS